MTITELKEKIKYLDDDMKVGGLGHFGEFLECWDARVRVASIKGKKIEDFFSISIENAGPDPD